jgi:hypothetical protein
MLHERDEKRRNKEMPNKQKKKKALPKKYTKNKK